MVFEYMDHDLTGLADRPGMRFSVPQIKVSRCSDYKFLFLSSFLLFAAINSYLVIVFFASSLSLSLVLHEAAFDRASLLSCKSSTSS